MVLGGGVAAYGAAQELAAQGVDTLLPLTYDPAEEMQRARQLYLGDYHYYDRLERLIGEVEASPQVNQTRVGALQQVSGKFGDYTVTFASPDGQDHVDFKAGAIIAALDWEHVHQLPELGHDGDSGDLPDRDERTHPAGWTHRGPGDFLDQRSGGRPAFCGAALHEKRLDYGHPSAGKFPRHPGGDPL